MPATPGYRFFLGTMIALAAAILASIGGLAVIVLGRGTSFDHPPGPLFDNESWLIVPLVWMITLVVIPAFTCLFGLKGNWHETASLPGPWALAFIRRASGIAMASGLSAACLVYLF